MSTTPLAAAEVLDLAASAWFTTYSGIKFTPFAPVREDIAIEDIAHHLAGMNRWHGATVRPLSIAQHSVHVAELVPPGYQLWALLHDASEAYLSDIPTNIKRHPAMAAYRAAEAILQRTIYHRFGLTGEEPEIVKLADRWMAVSEAQDCLKRIPAHFPEEIRNRTADRSLFPVVCWDAETAEARFLEMFDALTGGAQ